MQRLYNSFIRECNWMLHMYQHTWQRSQKESTYVAKISEKINIRGKDLRISEKTTLINIAKFGFKIVFQLHSIHRYSLIRLLALPRIFSQCVQKMK